MNIAAGQVGRYTFQPGWKGSCLKPVVGTDSCQVEHVGYCVAGKIHASYGDGKQPKLLLQRVDEPKSGKNRMHVDIETPHVDEKVARLEKFGAGRIVGDAIEEHGNRWIVMADPGGIEFCVCNAAVPD
jgi:hypothetical protein